MLLEAHILQALNENPSLTRDELAKLLQRTTRYSFTDVQCAYDAIFLYPPRKNPMAKPKTENPTKPLFNAYAQAESDATAAKQRMNDAVKAIFEAKKSKGPFKFEGQTLSIVTRIVKVKDASVEGGEREETLYSFKRMQQAVEEID